MVIETPDGSSMQKCIINASATYIWHKHKKNKLRKNNIKQSSQQEMELTNNSE